MKRSAAVKKAAMRSCGTAPSSRTRSRSDADREPQRGRWPDRTAVAVTLDHDRRRRRERAAQQPRPCGKLQPVDVRDVRLTAGDGCAEPGTTEQIVDLAAADLRVAVKPLHD